MIPLNLGKSSGCFKLSTPRSGPVPEMETSPALKAWIPLAKWKILGLKYGYFKNTKKKNPKVKPVKSSKLIDISLKNPQVQKLQLRRNVCLHSARIATIIPRTTWKRNDLHVR